MLLYRNESWNKVSVFEAPPDFGSIEIILHLNRFKSTVLDV